MGLLPKKALRGLAEASLGLALACLGLALTSLGLDWVPHRAV